MFLQHSHICFADGTSVPYSAIKTVADVDAIQIRILQTEPRSENREEIRERLDNLSRFFAGEIVFACNANHAFPGTEPAYNYGFIFQGGRIVRVYRDGSDTGTEVGLSPFDLTIYTPFRPTFFFGSDGIPKTRAESTPEPRRVVAANRELLWSHGGIDYYDDNPRAAINAALSTAQGRSAKARAWNDAFAALEMCRRFFPEISDNLKAALGNGRYPEPASI